MTMKLALLAAAAAGVLATGHCSEHVGANSDGTAAALRDEHYTQGLEYGISGAYGVSPLKDVEAYSASDCQVRCAKDGECKFFAFDSASKQCSMFASGGDVQAADNEVSGAHDRWASTSPDCALNGIRYDGTPLETVQAEDPNECQEHCQRSSSCEAFVFLKDRTCHLHLGTAALKKVGDSDSISGPRDCNPSCALPSVQYTSDDAKVLEGAANAPECQLMCQGTTMCQNWSYDTETGKCTSFGRITSTILVPGFIGGSKLCGGGCDLIDHQSPCLDDLGWSESSKEPDYFSCKSRCDQDERCKSFTYWSNKECHIRSAVCLMNVTYTKDSRTGFKGYCAPCIRQGVGYAPDENAVLWQLPTENAEECRIRCSMAEHCTFFTYNALTKDCHLLSGATADVEDDVLQSGMSDCNRDISCIKQGHFLENGVDVHIDEDVPSAEECQELCARNPECELFTYKTSTGECFHKKAESTTLVQNWEWASGVAKCVKVDGICAEADTDFSLSDIKESTANSTEQCREICYAEPLCRAYTFNHENKKCWSKYISAINDRKPNNQACSGGRMGCSICARRGFTYTGSLIKTETLKTPIQCQLACEADGECKFYTFKGTSCKLFKDAGTPEEDEDSISGPKIC